MTSTFFAIFVGYFRVGHALRGFFFVRAVGRSKIKGESINPNPLQREMFTSMLFKILGSDCPPSPSGSDGPVEATNIYHCWFRLVVSRARVISKSIINFPQKIVQVYLSIAESVQFLNFRLGI